MAKQVKYPSKWQRRMFLALSLAVITTALVPAIVGPLRTSNAASAISQTYTWRNVVTGGGGGFVVDIIFNSKRKDLIYARTDIGGAYRWNASTSSWTQLLSWVSPEQWNMMGVESIATDPVNPNRLYIAAGTYTASFAG